MTPPAVDDNFKVHSGFPQEDPPSWDEGLKKPPCKSGCHASPDTSAFSKFPSHGSLLSKSGGKNTSIYDNKFLADWIESSKKSKEDPKPAAAAPTVAPAPSGEPIDITPLTKEAQKLEKLAETSKSPEEKIAYYRDAVKIYRLVQNVDDVKRVLGLLKKEYEGVKNEAGVLEVGSELAFTDGKFEEALKGLRTLEKLLSDESLKLPQEERDAALLEINLKISLSLQGLAAQESKEKKWDSAIAHMEEALTRTPSPLLTEKTLELWKLSGKSDLAAIRKQNDAELMKLAEEITRLYNTKPCNGGCHAPAVDPNAVDARTVLMSLAGSPLLGDALSDRQSMEAWIRGEEIDPLAIPKDEPSARFAFRPSRLSTKHWLSPEQLARIDELQTQVLKRKAELDKEYAKTRAHLAWVVKMGYPAGKDPAEKMQSQRRIAQVMAEHGDREVAIRLYQGVLKKPFHSAETDKVERAKEILTRTEITHEMAGLYLQTGNYGSATELLDKQLLELQSIDPSKTPKIGDMDLRAAVETLQIQNRFLKAEALLAKAGKPEELQEGIRVLEDLATNPTTQLAKLDKSDPRFALLGRVKLRLAQILLGQDTASFRGKDLVEQIKRDFSGDTPDNLYLRSEAEFAYGLAVLQTDGKTLEGLALLRDVQQKYKGSQADHALRNSPTIAHLRGSDGVIRAHIDEGDIGEMLKVAIDRRHEGGSAFRKIAATGTGVGAVALVAVLLTWEVSVPLLLLGGAIGYGTNSVIYNSDKIADAYRTGISNVDTSRHFQNLFMLGLEVAMLVTAGAGGAVARKGAEYGLGWAANRAAGYMARTGFGVATAQRAMAWVASSEIRTVIAGYVGRRLIPGLAEGTAASLIMSGERSLILGEEFKWSPKDALLMFVMCEAFAFARFAGTGAKFATKPVFNRGVTAVLKQGEVVGFKDAAGKMLTPVVKDGKLAHYADAAGHKYSPVTQYGKVVGLTNTAGQVVVFATDLVVGASMYYAFLLGPGKALGLVDGKIPDFDKFLEEQIKTLSALHAGSKLAHRAGLGAMDRALTRVDKKAGELLKQAKETIEKAKPRDPGGPSSWDPFGPFGMELSPVGGYGLESTRRYWNRSDPKKPNAMMMENNGEGGGGKPLEELWPLEEALMTEELYIQPMNSPKDPKGLTIRVDLKEGSELDTVAGALRTASLPKELKKVRLLLEKEPTVSELADLIRLSKQKAIEIEVGHLAGTDGKKFYPFAEILSGNISLHLMDLRSAGVAVSEAVRTQQKISIQVLSLETISVEPGASSTTIKLKNGGTITLSAGTNGKAASTAKVVIESPSKNAASVLQLAGGLDPLVFKGARVEIKGVDLVKDRSARSASGRVLRQALWGGCYSVEAGRDFSVSLNPPNGTMKYSFQTPHSLKMVNNIFGEYLAFETAPALGAKGVNDPRVAEIAQFWKTAISQISNLDKHWSLDKAELASRSKKAGEKAEYQDFLEKDWLRNPQNSNWVQELRNPSSKNDWVKTWEESAKAMILYSQKGPSNQKLLADAFDRVRDFSEPPNEDFLGFKPFNSRAFADNAFEMIRIFRAASRDSKLNLDPILTDMTKLLGKHGQGEFYGAVVGTLYKAKVPTGYDSKNNPIYDRASVNEYDALLQMVKETAGKKYSYRLTVIPEDYHQGSNRNTPEYTKTPEWILEKLSAEGRPEKALAVEAKRRKGPEMTDGQIKKLIADAVYQVTDGHQFVQSVSNKDGLIIVKFWDAKGLEKDLTDQVQKALAEEYQYRRTTEKTKVRVKIIFADANDKPLSNRFLEYDGKGGWKLRSVNGVTEASGDKWLEPVPEAVGWE